MSFRDARRTNLSGIAIVADCGDKYDLSTQNEDMEGVWLRAVRSTPTARYQVHRPLDTGCPGEAAKTAWLLGQEEVTPCLPDNCRRWKTSFATPTRGSAPAPGYRLYSEVSPAATVAEDQSIPPAPGRVPNTTVGMRGNRLRRQRTVLAVPVLAMRQGMPTFNHWSGSISYASRISIPSDSGSLTQQ